MIKAIILSIFIAIAIAQSSSRPAWTGSTRQYTGPSLPPPTGTRVPRPTGRPGREIKRDLLTDSELIVSSRKRTGDTASFMRFIIRAARGLEATNGLIVRMDGAYKAKGKNGVRLDNRIKFIGLQYYVENGVAGSGLQSDDTRTAFVDIGDINWKPFNDPNAPICTNANGQMTCSVVSADNTIGLNLYFQESDVTIEGIPVNSTAMKFDFWFDKTIGEEVALVAKLESRSIVRERTDSSLTVTKQRGFGTDADAGYFDFADNFFYQGAESTTFPVVVSQFVDESSTDVGQRPHSKLITFSFISTDSGKRLIWDPVVGSNEDSDSSAITNTVSLIFMIVAFVFAL